MMLLALAAASFTQADVLAVRQTCHLPGSWIRLTTEPGTRSRLRLKPSREADYRKVNCMLGAIKRIAQARGEWPNMGFVGNEAPEPGKTPE